MGCVISRSLGVAKERSYFFQYFLDCGGKLRNLTYNGQSATNPPTLAFFLAQMGLQIMNMDSRARWTQHYYAGTLQLTAAESDRHRPQQYQYWPSITVRCVRVAVGAVFLDLLFLDLASTIHRKEDHAYIIVQKKTPLDLYQKRETHHPSSNPPRTIEL
jgi:hypothetical protein